MSILSGLGIIVFPISESVGGQIYKYGGYYAVYATSLAFTFLGVLYIFFVPESVTAKAGSRDGNGRNTGQGETTSLLDGRWVKLYRAAKHAFVVGNQTIVESYRLVYFLNNT